MKKLFSFVCACICAISLNAQTQTQTYYVQGYNNWGNGDEMTTSEDGFYAYYQATKESGAEFKITGSKTGYNPEYNWGDVTNAFNGTDITLSQGGGQNIKISEKGYILIYFPNTEANTSDKHVVCASTTLPSGKIVLEEHTITFGVIGENGTLTAKSGDTDITSGSKVSSVVTLTATPADGYEVEGWYSDAEGTTALEGASGNTHSVVLTADMSVYVKFATPSYWLKHPWGGGSDWSWKECTANEDGTYSLIAQYGGNGCNWKKGKNGSDSWIAEPNKVGTLTVGDNALFILSFNEQGKASITIKEMTSTARTNTEAENATVKVIRNGQVLIVREGVTYNMMGQTIQ